METVKRPTRLKVVLKYLKAVIHLVGIFAIITSLTYMSLFYKDYKESRDLMNSFIVNKTGEDERYFRSSILDVINYPASTIASSTILLASYVSYRIVDYNNKEEQSDKYILYEEDIFESLKQYDNLPIIRWTLESKDVVDNILDLRDSNENTGEVRYSPDMESLNQIINTNTTLVVVNFIAAKYLILVIIYWFIALLGYLLKRKQRVV